MNAAQRIILIVGLSVILLIGLFPPWRLVGFGLNGGQVVPVDMAAGRQLVLVGPDESANQRARVDGGLLLAEIVVIGGATGLAICACASPWSNKQADKRAK